MEVKARQRKAVRAATCCALGNKRGNCSHCIALSGKSETVETGYRKRVSGGFKVGEMKDMSRVEGCGERTLSSLIVQERLRKEGTTSSYERQQIRNDETYGKHSTQDSEVHENETA